MEGDMRFKEIVPLKDFQKTYRALSLLLSFLAVTGIVFCSFYTDPFDNEELPDISLHNFGISYQTFNQLIFFDTQIQPNWLTQVCINAILTRAPPSSNLF
jgi:hypothetical protein